MSESDESLVARSQQGDRAAFEELVRRTARLVFSRIYLEIGHRDRTEDLVQEAYLVAWRSIRQVTEAGGFRTWLLSVAHSVVVDARRRDMRKKRSGPRADPEAILTLASTGAAPHEVAERNEARQKVLLALRALPEEYRAPLMLRYLAGADYDTIERQLALSNGALRGMLNRGLVRMRQELTRLGWADRGTP